MELENVLNGESTEQATEVVEVAPQAEEVEEQSVETPEPEVTEEPTEEPAGLKDDGDGLPPPQELTKQLEDTRRELNAYKTKARDEKLKRQELEANKQEEPLPDVLDDQEGFVGKVLSRSEQARLNDRFQSSEFRARREFGAEKIDECIDKFAELVSSSPELSKEINSSPEPYYTMVDIVERQEKLAEAKDPNFREKLRAELRAEVEAEVKADFEAKQKEVSGIKKSLASHGSSEIGSDTWSGPTPLNNLINS